MKEAIPQGFYYDEEEDDFYEMLFIWDMDNATRTYFDPATAKIFKDRWGHRKEEFPTLPLTRKRLET